jgi:DNA-binding FadR family transcriptional regulator
VLEIAIAELAAARADPHQLQSLEEILEQAQDVASIENDKGTLVLSIDPRFHSAIARASQNEALFRTNQSFLRQLAVAYDMIPLGQEHRTLEVSSMAAVVDAIKRRSPTDARIAMAVHVSYFRPLVDLFFGEEESRNSHVGDERRS